MYKLLRSPAITRTVSLNTQRSATRYSQRTFFSTTKSTENEAKPEGETKSETAAETESQEPVDYAKYKEMEEKYMKKDKEFAELKDRYLRSIADYRNLQETTKREIQKAKDFALQKFAKDLLESVDNFGHALNAVDEDILKTNKEIKNLYDGVQMTKEVFEKTLARHGIEKINPIGEKFDPNVHEATFEVPQPDKEPGTVFHVQQPGYSLNSRVLRAAKVGVVKGPE